MVFWWAFFLGFPHEMFHYRICAGKVPRAEDSNKGAFGILGGFWGLFTDLIKPF